MGAIFVYSLKTGKLHQITDGMSDADTPVFDKGGKYLYFTASTDIGPAVGSGMSVFNRPVTRRFTSLCLNKNDPRRLATESDDEEIRTRRTPTSEGRQEGGEREGREEGRKGQGRKRQRRQGEERGKKAGSR